MLRYPIVLLALSCSLIHSALAELSVTATFNPPRIALGDKSQYLVEITETSTGQRPTTERVDSLPIPQSGGLELTNGRVSNSSHTSIVNGVAEYSSTLQLIIDARAPQTGRFTIPTYTFQYKGETLRAPAVTLQVVERSADAGPTIDELIFLTAEVPEQLYVGQTTPIVLKLYISTDVRLSGLSSFDRDADGFTISELPDSKESSEVYNGRRYRVLNWPLLITPIQAGAQDINFQFSVAAQIPNQNNRRDPMSRRGFGSSIFDDFFGRSERFDVYTKPTSIDVRPVPSKNKPDSFTGAIGDFALQVYTDLQSTKVGEPIMLSVEVSGQGNFDRIGGPLIPDSEKWRTYEPETQFQPSAPGNALRGTKRFDYVLIPRKAGTLKVPPLEFSYLDPSTDQYTTLAAPEIDIEVSPSDLRIAPSTQVETTDIPEQAQPAQPQQREITIKEALLTLDYRPEPATSANGRILKNPLFWLSNAAVAGLLGFVCHALRHRRRLRENREYAALHAAKQERDQAIKEAHRAKDAATFYHAAQNAIRLTATYKARRSLRSADIDELTEFLRSQQTSESIVEQTRALFFEADQIRFSQQTASDNMTAAKANLEGILKAL